ncbi:HNH endonuclease [Arthrobacter phage Emotion]|uniref:HNH endonuclease n=1 Tax=Arthrobacter phage Emotion TaxID=3038361 RepID=A0AA49ERZ2_9CAUD|nr:HNH endonuclease [Arthrobacter phage Emotion]
MAWDTSDRGARLPDNWPSLRIRVLRRDGYKCQAVDSLGHRCNAPANQVDHIKPGDDHDLDNLQALCRWHHSRKSSAEGAAARRPKLTRAREPERHPGMIDPDVSRETFDEDDPPPF